MKKYLAGFLTVLLLFATVIPVYALNKAVTITSSSITTSTVTVKGTTEALAVAIQVRDKSENIVGMATDNTVSGAFDATIKNLKLTAGETYKIYVADYEGGDFAVATGAAVEDSKAGTNGQDGSAAHVKDAVPKTGVDDLKTETDSLAVFLAMSTLVCCFAGVTLQKRKAAKEVA